METIVVYSAETSNRLQYVLHWLFIEQLRMDYTLVHDEAAVANLPFFISYGAIAPKAISIPAVHLLWEKEILLHTIPLGVCDDLPCLYAVDEIGYTLSYDLFASIFFLLSRYEEYSNAYTADKHGRYPATESLLYKNGWLQRPILDEWVQAFRNLLAKHTKSQIATPLFTYQPTYDIDIAYSYRYKGFSRALGGFLKDLSAAKLQGLKDRALVLFSNKPDPYDSFDALKKLHDDLNIHPVFFILAALQTTAFDKNILPSQPRMQALIQELGTQGRIGVHPSYYTDKSGMLYEKEILEKYSGQKINISRQHYIKLKLPDTYRTLINEGISADYSMGYGAKLGFRAGTGRSFLWYDLKNEQSSKLRIHPFCFMDTTAFFEEKLSAEKAFEVLRSMRDILKTCGSELITVFHNFSLGSSPEWQGWWAAYTAFVKETFTTS